VLHRYTLAQVERFLEAVERNQSADYALLANVARVSYHGDRKDFGNFVRKLTKSSSDKAHGKVIRVDSKQGIASFQAFLGGKSRRK